MVQVGFITQYRSPHDALGLWPSVCKSRRDLYPVINVGSSSVQMQMIEATVSPRDEPSKQGTKMETFESDQCRH